MVIRKLIRSGGSILVLLPKPFLEQLNLRGDAQVQLEIEEGRIVISKAVDAACEA